MAKSKHFYIRKAHRYLGVFLGIQFLMWTISGLYFSWTNIDNVHGDFQKKTMPLLSANLPIVSPGMVLENIKAVQPVDSLMTVQLIRVNGRAVYQVQYMHTMSSAAGNKHAMHRMNQLADAATGQLRGPLTEDEAVEMAKAAFNGQPEVKSVEYIEATGAHHEYRENPLPAYAITFRHPTNTTVYVASELGTIQKFRNNKWRVFDFLWMTHTMDYAGRDNINNILLRIFSIVGLVTVLSGFLLFFISSRRIKRWVNIKSAI